MTEGTGHVIDPAGDARRALQDAVTSHGPEVLSDATVMDHLCRTQLTALPGECILIVSAARSDVPALLRDAIPQYGNYGAIQFVATTLAQASDLDGAASLWVVREFARALGLIAPGGTQSMPRPAPGGTGTGAPGSAVAAGAGAAGAAAAAARGRMGAGGMGAGGMRRRGAVAEPGCQADRECRAARSWRRGWREDRSQGWQGDRSRGWGAVRRGGGRQGPSCSTATRWG